MINIENGAQVQQRGREMKRTCSRKLFTVCVHLKKQYWSDRKNELASETCATQRECRASLQSHNHRQSDNVVVHIENLSCSNNLK